MGKLYVKKRIPIEAWKLTSENYIDMHDLVNNVDSSSIFGSVIGMIMKEKEKYGGLPIPTLEGTMVARIGDYIIKGINSEFYPCKPDIFEKSYEEYVEEIENEK